MRRGRGAVFGFVEEVEGVEDIVCCSMDVVIVIVVRHFFRSMDLVEEKDDVAVRATGLPPCFNLPPF